MDSRIERSLLLIAKSFQQELQLADLANEANLSAFHFHRLFKSQTGQTPLEYINKIKLEYAAHYLILYHTCSMIEVAFESGYSSPAVFSRSFKNFYKMTPVAYRKRAIKMPNKIEIKQKPDFPIEYFNQKTINVKRVSLIENALNEAYKKLIMENDSSSTGIGIYIDTPFHKKLEECRHYIGTELKDRKHNVHSILTIPSGYYTHLTINGSFDKLREQIEPFKENKLDPAEYVIKSLSPFETIQLPNDPAGFDYFSTPRKLYIQISKK